MEFLCNEIATVSRFLELLHRLVQSRQRDVQIRARRLDVGMAQHGLNVMKRG